MSRRELGSVYTPQAIAARMARACLERLLDDEADAENEAASSACRVLDPACGDGAFLLEVFDELCGRLQSATGVDAAPGENPAGAELRLAIVRDHIFGVDIDPPAVTTLREKLLERIGAEGGLIDEAVAAVEANIRLGDSLTGPDFATALPGWPGLARSEAPAGDKSGRRTKQRDLFAKFPESDNRLGSSEVDGTDSPPGLPFGPAPATPGACPPAIDWQRAFPAAFAAGGFDIIIGNPPYVRERNAKSLFDAVAATELGRKWREARMDLWYYFVHRSLDMLRPGGILSFIVNSYWMSSRGAGKLIDRLRRETSFEEIVLLENARVFKDVAGRHMIFRLRKEGGKPNAVCRVITSTDEYAVSHCELFQPGRLVVARPDSGQTIFENRIPLGEFHDTRQGMAENAPAVNRRLHREFGGRFPVGMGIFVLQQDEVARLNLSTVEQTLLRPYYDTQAVGRYRIADEPTHQVLYLTRATAPSLDGLASIAAHLEQFRPILERRREVQSGKMAWWHLHWPRNEQIFVRPRILSVQMGKRPQFVFAERPTFVGFSINLILAKAEETFPLDVLCGILNSNLALTWFDRHAKRRGINLEINAHLLRQFPLPGRHAEIERAIGDLVRERQRIHDDGSQAAVLEKEIEDRVSRLYKAGRIHE